VSLGVEASERIVLYAVTDLDWVAADFTVFDVALPANRQVENHRNLFPAIRASEGVFHRDSMVQRVLQSTCTCLLWKRHFRSFRIGYAGLTRFRLVATD
jgi:hypothetical protein